MIQKIITICNAKGGVGKTTSTASIGACMALMGKKVLLIDLDGQANLTLYYIPNDSEIEVSIFDSLISGEPLPIINVKENLDIVPSSLEMASAEIALTNLLAREQILSRLLDDVKQDYDYILIDCPPSLEMLTLNGLAAAEGILVPVQCEYYALEGLSDLLTTLRMVKKRINPQLEIFGVALTMFDGRTNFSTQVAQEVRRHFPGKVFASVIPRNIRLAEAPSHGLPVTAYDRSSRGAQAYRDLANEIYDKLKER